MTLGRISHRIALLRAHFPIRPALGQVRGLRIKDAQGVLRNPIPDPDAPPPSHPSSGARRNGGAREPAPREDDLGRASNQETVHRPTSSGTADSHNTDKRSRVLEVSVALLLATWSTWYIFGRAIPASGTAPSDTASFVHASVANAPQTQQSAGAVKVGKRAAGMQDLDAALEPVI